MTLEFDDRAESGVDEAAVASVIDAVLTAENVGEVEVGVVLVDAFEMQEINREHRGKDEPTDVLSFPIDDDDDLLEAPFERIPDRDWSPEQRVDGAEGDAQDDVERDREEQGQPGE